MEVITPEKAEFGQRFFRSIPHAYGEFSNVVHEPWIIVLKILGEHCSSILWGSWQCLCI